jgi:hypothetical protein
VGLRERVGEREVDCVTGGVEGEVFWGCWSEVVPSWWKEEGGLNRQIMHPGGK